MLNIAIEDSNTLYRNGFELFIEKLLRNEASSSIEFQTLTRINAIEADIIVKEFSAGAQFICQSELKYRTKPGLIIGIYDAEKKPHHKKLPLCIKDIIFISRSESLSSARETISTAWQETKAMPKSPHCNKCAQCKYLRLTPQQILIAKALLHGEDILKISQKLNISIKTASAHKRLIMSKFNLRNDCELLFFLKILKEKNQQIYL